MVSEIVRVALEEFAEAKEAWDDNYQRGLHDLKFSFGDQWPDEIRRLRENSVKGPRPCLTVDKIGQYIRQVENDARQNRPAIKVRPVGDGADEKVAEMLQGLVRNIEEQSSADIAYDTGISMALRCGIGFIRVCQDYIAGESMYQELRIDPVDNPFAVYLDPSFKKPDGSDAKYAFVIHDMDRELFKKAYPEADFCDWAESTVSTGASGWVSEKSLRVAEYWKIEETPRVVSKNGKTHTIYDKKVIWRKITATEVLETTEWPCQWIGIVPVFGRLVNIDGSRQIYSLVNPAIDAQRMHNYAASAYAERVALMPKSPYVAAEGQIEGHEDEWQSANVENFPVLTYKETSIGGQMVPPPQRQVGGEIPTGWQQLMQNNEHDIQAALGMYNPSVGAPSNERSGKAILARQREADIATSDYTDNLARAIRHLGRILVAMIPKVYDTDRIVRLVSEDGSMSEARISPTMESAHVAKRDNLGQIVEQIYNPSIGQYDIVVSTGPSFTTRRQEAADFMNQVIQTAPEMLSMIGDLMFKSMDMPYSEDIAKRLKVMLPEPIQKMENEASPIPPEAQAQILQRDQALQQMQQALQQMQMELEQNRTAAMKSEVDAKKIEVEQFKAETERMSAEMEASKLLEDQAQVQQIVQVVGDQIGQLAQAVNQLAQMLGQQQEAMTGHMAEMTTMICQHAEEKRDEVTQIVEALGAALASEINKPRQVSKTGKAVRNDDGTWSLAVDEVMH